MVIKSDSNSATVAHCGDTLQREEPQKIEQKRPEFPEIHMMSAWQMTCLKQQTTSTLKSWGERKIRGHRLPCSAEK
jgi:hypothetical protein